jgi:hypothetical protein
MCEKPIIPEKGYFKTQLFGKKMCHVGCEPKFYYDNKPPEIDQSQKQLFPEEWREQK